MTLLKLTIFWLIYYFLHSFFTGIYLEEKKLIKTFGEEYLEYKRNVPMLIPHLKRQADL